MHTVDPTGIDTFAAILVIVIITASLLTLLGMGIMMAVGAVFASRPLVTSWSEHEQHAFTAYEQRGTASNARAWAVSLVASGLVAVLAIGVYVGVEPDRKNISKDMNMSNLTKKRTPAAPKPDAAPAAEAPKPAAEAPKPAADPAPAAPAEAPKQ